MAASPLSELEDLTLCSYCRRAFDEGEQQPKVLACKHHFCLKCVNSVLLKGRELYCLHCWKRTELPADARPDSLPTHGALVALARRLAAGSLPPVPPAAAADECTAHGLPMSLWCVGCDMSLCRGCPGHVGHTVQQAAEARTTLRRDIARDLHHTHRLLDDLQRLVFRQRDFLLKILEACTTLKTQLETELVNNPAGFEIAEAREALEGARRALTTDSRPAELRSMMTGLANERERLQARHRDMYLQCRLDDLIRGARVALDFDLLKRTLADAHTTEQPPAPDDGYRNPVLFLANYCMSQLYSRHCLMKRQDIMVHNGDLQYSLPAFLPQPIGKPPLDSQLKPSYIELTNNNNVIGKHSPLGFGDAGPVSPATKTNAFQTETLSLALPSMNALSPQPILRNPTSHVFPLFYFNIEVNGTPFGRIVIEVRNDVAPRMARNFSVLTTGEYGIGYKGCSVFQCWENESVITGDFEHNNGRGGRSVFEESYFMPDDTKMVAVRGSVGMRRSQKRHDNLGLVGSQFRVILREMRGFTGIFAFVAEGLELVDRLSQTGDSAGKPQSSILIASCGKLN